MPPEEAYGIMAQHFAAHARLPLGGPSETWRFFNHTRDKIFLELQAPSEGLAIARYGALTGQSFAQINKASTQPLSVCRVSCESEMERVARQALTNAGLSD